MEAQHKENTSKLEKERGSPALPSSFPIVALRLREEVNKISNCENISSS